jgi:hypothetical protein
MLLFRRLANQSCQLSQAAQAHLRNPLGYLHCKSLATLPHCLTVANYKLSCLKQEHRIE